MAQKMHTGGTEECRSGAVIASPRCFKAAPREWCIAAEKKMLMTNGVIAAELPARPTHQRLDADPQLAATGSCSLRCRSLHPAAMTKKRR